VGIGRSEEKERSQREEDKIVVDDKIEVGRVEILERGSVNLVPKFV
jgi:hypothetical protein